MSVVEEIELGLHPEALIRLARHLQEVILQKKLQIIVSTHSQHFIDSVPREARVLIRRAGSQHLVIPQPTTRFAVGNMSGEHEPELHVYCEDNFAMLLIEQSLSGPLRQRTHVVPVGSESQLAQQGSFHLNTNLGQHMLLVWDGDVSVTDAQQQLRRAKLTEESLEERVFERVNWTFLPGGKAPEQWAVEVLDCAEGHELLGTELGESATATAELIERLKALDDAHNIGYELGRTCNIEKNEALRCLVRAVARLSSKPLASVCGAVEAVLEGNYVSGNRVRA